MNQPPEPPILVSACLLGLATRYDGGAKLDTRLLPLLRAGRLLPVCPEQLGGLPTPRKPYERRGDRVVAADGQDVTEDFRRGVDEVCGLAELAGCRLAILKSRSPSCGLGEIYDGTFTGRRIPGDGYLTEALKQMGVEVVSEVDERLEALLRG